MSNEKPEVVKLVLGPLQTNCYLVVCPETHAALVIDPADQPDRVISAALRKAARIEQILLTHAHPDHLGGLIPLRNSTRARVLAHRLDAEMLERNARFYGIGSAILSDLLPDTRLEGGEEIAIGQLTGNVLHTPGHSPGSITLKVGNMLFTGDTLFAQGVGRVDLPGGSWEALLESIQQLFTLPDECAVYPGHGPATTIGDEKRDNPYV